MPGTNPADAPAVYGFAAQIGFRVPNFVISPFSRRHFVNHTAMDHTAVIRFVEQRFGLSPLTQRDAAQPSLTNFFDFSNAPWLTPPSPPTPADVGSTCHPAQLQ
jgi:phospholipase C